MPTYEYHCKSCGHSYECFQKISEKPLKTCPRCHQEALHRGIGGGGARFQFKGKGFYATDSKESSKQSTPNQKTAGGCGCSNPSCPH